MGAILPKPILSKLVERTASEHCSAAICEINGQRMSMEDAHCMKIHPDRLIFGVFDGHSGDQCSRRIAVDIPDRLARLPLPLAPVSIEKLCLDVDEAFLTSSYEPPSAEGGGAESVASSRKSPTTGGPPPPQAASNQNHQTNTNTNNTNSLCDPTTPPQGGSTASFIAVERPPSTEGTFRATVSNVGDSRTIVMRNGAVIFVTSDHRPSAPPERKRIEATGGSVQMNRVDGDLAVSRAFGDATFKRSHPTSADPRLRRVSCVPDVTSLTLHWNDLIVIACDGVFEGSFSTEEVAQFIAQHTPPKSGDWGFVAARVCDQAVRRGSKDNISCMIIQLTDGLESIALHGRVSFVPGPPYTRTHDNSRRQYAIMAGRAGMTLAHALEKRWQLLQLHLNGQLERTPVLSHSAFEMSTDPEELEREMQFFGAGPPQGAPEGVIRGWFQALADGDAPPPSSSSTSAFASASASASASAAADSSGSASSLPQPSAAAANAIPTIMSSTASDGGGSISSASANAAAAAVSSPPPAQRQSFHHHQDPNINTLNHGRPHQSQQQQQSPRHIRGDRAADADDPTTAGLLSSVGKRLSDSRGSANGNPNGSSTARNEGGGGGGGDTTTTTTTTSSSSPVRQQHQHSPPSPSGTRKAATVAPATAESRPHHHHNGYTATQKRRDSPTDPSPPSPIRIAPQTSATAKRRAPSSSAKKDEAE